MYNGAMRYCRVFFNNMQNAVQSHQHFIPICLTDVNQNSPSTIIKYLHDKFVLLLGYLIKCMHFVCAVYFYN